MHLEGRRGGPRRRRPELAVARHDRRPRRERLGLRRRRRGRHEEDQSHQQDEPPRPTLLAAEPPRAEDRVVLWRLPLLAACVLVATAAPAYGDTQVGLSPAVGGPGQPPAGP